MEPLARLKARVSSLRELRDLFRALRALAASHIQEAQAALAGIRRHVEVVEHAIAEGAALLPKTDERRSVAVRPDGSALIAVCSEHGFVGAFNEQLLERAVAEREARQDLIVIGRRGSGLAAEQGLEVQRSFPMPTHVGGILGVTRRVADHLAGIASVDIVFGSYRRGGAFETQTRTILPLDPALLAASERRSPPLHHLRPEVLLERLAGEYVFAEITRAVMESFASENGARLRVMEAADRNTGDKLDALRRKEQTLRQEAITSELIDVVTGAEAVLGHES